MHEGQGWRAAGALGREEPRGSFAGRREETGPGNHRTPGKKSGRVRCREAGEARTGALAGITESGPGVSPRHPPAVSGEDVEPLERGRSAVAE